MQSLFNEYVTPVSPSLYRQGLLVFRETAKLAPSVLQLFSYFCLVVTCITPVALRRASAASPLQSLPPLPRHCQALVAAPKHVTSPRTLPPSPCPGPRLPPHCHSPPLPGRRHALVASALPPSPPQL